MKLTKKSEITSGDETIAMEVDEKEYKKGDEIVAMDVAPFEEGGAVYLPLRYVAEAFGRKYTGEATPEPSSWEAI